MSALLTASQLEFASSVKQEDVPIKLRCAVCNKLNVHAFKLPCCDQSICESCHTKLPDSCPVCAHSPISADTCTPHKSLRQTVKVWIKSQEKKRDDKERAAKVAAVPKASELASSVITSAPTSDQPQIEPDTAFAVSNVAQDGLAVAKDRVLDEPQIVQNEHPSNEQGSSAQLATFVIIPSVEENITGQTPDQGVDEVHITEGATEGAERDITEERGAANNEESGRKEQMQPGFENMDWNQNQAMNPMLQMPMNGNWGNFPNMMTMANMGMMDPMSMQNGMFGGFGAMGMNGMNMGGGYGNGWNGQQMGNDFSGGFYPSGGYNQSHQGHYPQHMNYQQQQYPRNKFHNRNRYQDHNAYAQGGYGRGADGGFGGPGFDQNYGQGQSHSMMPEQSAHAGDNASHNTEGNSAQLRDGDSASHPNGQEDAQEAENTADATAGQVVNKDNDGMNEDEKQKPLEHDTSDANKGPSGDQNSNQDQDAIHFNNNEGQDSSIQTDQQQYPSNLPNSHAQAGYEHYNMTDTTHHSNYPNDPMHSFDAYGNPIQQHYMMNGHGDYHLRGRGGYRGGYNRGGFNHRGGRPFNNSYRDMASDMTVVTPQEIRGQGVEGAPTGPKAMRTPRPARGGANGIGAHGLPSSGPQGHEEDDTKSNGSRSMGVDKREVASRSYEQDRRSRSRETLRERSRSRSRSYARSRSRSSSRKHSRRHRHRSKSAGTSSEAEARERRHERRKHRSRRDRREEEDDANSERPDEPTERDNKSREDRSRDESVESRHHRSRREKDRHRSSRSHRERSREHRRHRHRSRSPNRDDNVDAEHSSNEHEGSAGRRRDRNDRHKERDDGRTRDRDKDRDRERKSSRRDRSASANNDDRDHRSSRRSGRKEKEDRREKEQNRDRDRDRGSTSALPTPSESEFKIHGRSRDRKPSSATITIGPISMSSMKPPTGPKATTPRIPTGPSATHSRRESLASQQDTDSPRRKTFDTPAVPTEPASIPIDPYQAEREAAQRMRVEKEERRRQSLQSSSERKRSYTGEDDENGFAPPTGPSAERGYGRKRARPSDVARKPVRRVSYKYEDEENDEQRARRVESERESVRYH